MDVVIAGGHGKIALLLERLLSARGHRARGLIRNPDHAADVRAAGAEPVVADLEALDPGAIAAAIGPADALVFAAGAGPGSGPARKWTVDYGGVVATVAAAQANGIARYVVISAVGADPAAPDDGGFDTYLRAKGQADDAARASGLAWTIVRPGRLTDDAPTGSIRAPGEAGGLSIARADVAAVVAAVLERAETVERTIDVLGGWTPIDTALAALAA
jgi:uncharacterized protein YbjT (DUF2867 family)